MGGWGSVCGRDSACAAIFLQIRRSIQAQLAVSLAEYSVRQLYDDFGSVSKRKRGKLPLKLLERYMRASFVCVCVCVCVCVSASVCVSMCE